MSDHIDIEAHKWLLAREIAQLWPDWKFIGAQAIHAHGGRDRFTPYAFTVNEQTDSDCTPDIRHLPTIAGMFARAFPRGGCDYSPEPVEVYGPFRAWCAPDGGCERSTDRVHAMLLAIRNGRPVKHD